MINKDIDIREPLRICLGKFRGAEGTTLEARENSLKASFEALARKMTYGGFLQVGNDYEIYIRTVEFYYHEEDESETAIHDPIVYHRNGRFPGRNLPPFPMMSLNAHWSGFDITFEDPGGKYRASALIREYAVFDHHADKNGSWVYWYTGEGFEEGHYEPVKEPKFDGRSTYLQFYLNGFCIDGGANKVVWRDFSKPTYGRISVKWRRNVFKDKEKKIPSDRLWAFSREERLNQLKEEF